MRMAGQSHRELYLPLGLEELVGDDFIPGESPYIVLQFGAVALDAARQGMAIGDGSRRIFRPPWSKRSHVLVELKPDVDANADEIIEIIIQETADPCNGIIFEKVNDRIARIQGGLTRSALLEEADLDFDFTCTLRDGHSTPEDIDTVTRYIQAFYEQFPAPSG